MVNSTDSTYFSPSLSELYAAKVEIDKTDTSQPVPSHVGTKHMKPGDETADAPQPFTYLLGTRYMKPKAHKKKLKDYRNHGGPHHCGRRPAPDSTMPDKRSDLLKKAHAIELNEKDEADAAVQ
jgi:hypothetical protein